MGRNDSLLLVPRRPVVQSRSRAAPFAMAVLHLSLGGALFGSLACSENFGPLPADLQGPVRVAAESFTGPRLARAAISLVWVEGNLLLGTDRGLYRIELDGPNFRWWPQHGGFRSDSGVERVSSIELLGADPTGLLVLHATRGTVDDFLVATSDGGRSHHAVALPNVLARTVDALAVIPPGPAWSSGAWLVVQGGQIYHRAVDGTAWHEAELPAAATQLGPMAATASGAAVVAARTPTGTELWTSDDGARRFTRSSERPSGDVLALSVAADGRVAWTDSLGVHEGGSTLQWAGTEILASELDWRDSALQIALLGRADADAQIRWAFVSGIGGNLSSFPAPESARGATISVGAGVALLADALANVHRLADVPLPTIPFEGGDLDWGSVGVREDQRGVIGLGQRRTGIVYEGPASQPEQMSSRGTRLFQSESRSLLYDPAVPGALFAGSFGLGYNTAGSTVWEDRSAGLASYLLENFGGPIIVESLAARNTSELWLGGINGNGPYRSLDAGRSWSRAHDGLGMPGAIFGEDGLPALTEVRAFAFIADEIWMGGFRGGVWEFDTGSSRWEQRNRGLPNVSGAPVDTCCFEPAAQEIDVRALIVIPDGGLLAATGWGIYRDENRSGEWVDSSVGLRNRDVFALAAHPNRSGTIVAVTRGSVEAPEWLFLSQDAGRSWRSVNTALLGRWGRDVVWSDPDRFEVVTLLDSSGAWRLELEP